MQTERITFLATPAVKANMVARAEANGLSLGEYIRRKTIDDDELTPEQEAELAALVVQVNQAIPRMRESLEEMSKQMRETSAEIDAFLREKGLRK